MMQDTEIPTLLFRYTLKTKLILIVMQQGFFFSISTRGFELFNYMDIKGMSLIYQLQKRTPLLGEQ